MVEEKKHLTASIEEKRKNLNKFAHKLHPIALSKVDPHWITGFTDAEGSFLLDTSKKGYGVTLRFMIDQHPSNKEVLSVFQNYFNGGSVLYKPNKKDGRYRYDITGVMNGNLLKLIAHFDSYPLQSKKLKDYKIWREAVFSVQSKSHLTPEGRLKILELKSRLNN